MEALSSLGISTERVSWHDPSVDWDRFSVVIPSSTWDGVDRVDEFLAWADMVGQRSSLVNSAAIIAWNIDKRYLRTLEQANIAVVPTIWVEPGDTWEPPDHDFIVKPAISAGARNTAWYSPDSRDAARRHVALLGRHARTALVQPHIDSLTSELELSIIFIVDVATHAVRRGTPLIVNEGVVDRPWERTEFRGLATPTKEEYELAARTLGVVASQFEQHPTYARVDLVSDDDRCPLVLEVELIDPILSLDLAPKASKQLALALADERVRSH